MHPTFYILHFAFYISFVGCTDALDLSPDGRLSMEDIYKDPELVEAMVGTIYGGLPQKGHAYSFHTPLFTALSDDGWDANGNIGQANWGYASTHVYNGTISASFHSVANNCNGWSKNFWADYFVSIRLCNQFLQNTDAMVFKTENVKKRLIAEMHVLRAYYYFELMKFFGDVPIIEEALPLDHVFSNLQRDSVYKVAKFIAADCDFAINTPELPWRITVGEVVQQTGVAIHPVGEAGRVTKALAHAVKTTAMLFAASPLYNDGQNHWEEAYQFTKTAVEQLRANGYKLYNKTSSNFNPTVFGNWDGAAFHQYHCQVADYSAAPYDEETIYQTIAAAVHDPWNASLLWHLNYVGSRYSGYYQVGTTPTQELVDAFETTNGQPVLNLANPYADERHLSPNYNATNTLYDPANPYKNRDPRLYATVMMNGDTMIFKGKVVNIETFTAKNNNGTPITDGLLTVSTDINDIGRTKTGYFHRKIITPGMSEQGNPETPTYKHYRFAELLLDLAETANETGRTAEALAAMNEVRARVNMPPVPSMGKDELRMRIQNERRVEFAFEENRYFDLRRWSNPTDDLAKICKYLTAMWITRDCKNTADPSDDTYSYERRNVWDKARGGWENRDLLLPIPQLEQAKLEAITDAKWQNPGW
jgi:hypothetical protein